MSTIATPKTVRCCRCHCESTLPDLFQKTISGPVCPACVGKRAMRLNQLVYGLAMLLILVNIVGGWYLTGRPGRLGLDILTMLILSILLLTFHELSHAVAAQLLGGRVFGIHLGIGTLLRQQWIGNFYLGLSLLPAVGMCYAGFAAQRWIRLRHGLMVAAAPLFHLCLYLVMRYAGQRNPALFAMTWFGQLYYFNLLMGLFNLWPWLNAQTNMGAMQTDGSQLLKLLRGKLTAAQIHLNYFILMATFALYQKRNAQALVEVTNGLQHYPASEILHNLHGYLLMHNDRLAESLPIWQALAEAPPDAPTDVTVSPAHKALLQAIHYNNYAWVRLMLQATPADLAVAGTFAERAFAMAPWLTPIRGTMAAVKVARGDYNAGIAEALAVAADCQREHTPASAENRGSNLATAALGYHQLGEHEAARVTLTQAQALAPQDAAVRQATAAIHG